MIHYHGGPFSNAEAAVAVWSRRHAMVSFARTEQITIAANVAQSFALDNGAFSVWRRGEIPHWKRYYDWVSHWLVHPGCDFAIIPDVINGSEAENDRLVKDWPFDSALGVPVWHMHESLVRLRRLIRHWPRVAIGSSGKFSTPGTSSWWWRMSDIMRVCCRTDGRPRTKLHGLRMLNPALFCRLPLASADSTNVARNVQLDSRWRGTYLPRSKRVRGIILVDRIEAFNSTPTWHGSPSCEDGPSARAGGPPTGLHPLVRR